MNGIQAPWIDTPPQISKREEISDEELIEVMRSLFGIEEGEEK